MVIDQKLIDSMKEYAQAFNVPIMNDEGIKYLISYCKKNHVHKILEIGTAIGYSAIILASTGEDVEVTTIERDEKRYLEAVKNIKKASLENRIELIYQDALEVKVKDQYDLIFIDAAKAQNIKFFEKFQKNLVDGGTIITDNMNFHGLVETDESQIESRNVRQLVRKIKEYKTYLENNDKYFTTFKNIGDGLAISVKKQ